MIPRIELLPEAEQEVEDAFRWYERQRTGLGWSFLLSFEAALDRIRQTPDAHAVVARRTRRVLLRRFPCVVLFALDDRRILVTAVFHARRNPGLWADRIRESARTLMYRVPCIANVTA